MFDIILGPTPIVSVLRRILKDKRKQIYERKLLILLATDGEPTDHNGRPQVEELRNVLLNERRPLDRIPMTIIACTGNYTCNIHNNFFSSAIFP